MVAWLWWSLEPTTQLKMAVYGYRDAQRKIDLYGGSLIPQGEQALRLVDEVV